MNFYNLIKAEFVMLIGELKHYYFNYIFYNLGILLFFIGVIYNFDKSNGIIMTLTGLIFWHSIISSMSYICGVIQDEALMGTLEQLFLSDTPILKIFFSKIVVNLVFIVFKVAILFIICYLFYYNQVEQSISLWFIIEGLILLIGLNITAYCFGILLGGIALYFKRISSFVQVLSNILLFFSGIMAGSKIGIIQYYITPIPSALKIINQSLLYPGNIIIGDYIVFSLISLFYIIVSIIVFNKLLYMTKYNGKLANY